MPKSLAQSCELNQGAKSTSIIKPVNLKMVHPLTG